MTGLSAFRLVQAAPEPTPTYSGSYATTAQDARDKCQGNVVASVTRTATSTVSLVDAIQKATVAAKNAIACPVFTASYTTTPQDYTDKCGAGTSGASVTRSATSGVSQATAAAAAKQAALDAITCPVAPPSFDTTLDVANQNGDGVVFVPAGAQKMRYNTIANTKGNPVSLQITDTSDNSVSYATIADEYGNRPFAFDRANGSTYYGTYPTADSPISA